MNQQAPALAVRPELTPEIWQLIAQIAPAAHSSRLFGVASPEQAMMIMAKGHELGMPITAAFEHIQVIQNKPTLSPRGALALVLASDLLEAMQIEEQPGSCTVTMQRKHGPHYRLTWTLDDAQKAGVVKADSAWSSYPANMLRWRAIGFVIDVLFSDVTGGLKRADEFGASISDDGNVVTTPAYPDPEDPASIPGAKQPTITIVNANCDHAAAAVGNRVCPDCGQLLV